MVKLQSDNRRRRYLQIADQLAATIRTESMSAGERLPSERDLASRFEVSRQTVREALIALEVAGVVDIRLGSGVYVQSPHVTANRIEHEDAPGPLEIIEARRIIETEAAGLSAQRISNEELHKLKAALRLIRESEDNGDIVEAEAHDRKFHLLVAEGSRNSAIANTVDWLWKLRSQTDISRFFHQKVRAKGSQPSIDEHQKILEALIRRDPDAARSAMAEHIDRVYQEFSEFTLE